MIMYMNSKTFIRKFIKETPELVLGTQYVLVSQGISYGKKYDKQIIRLGSAYPPIGAILDIDDYTSEAYKKEYYKHIKDNNVIFTLATLVKYSIEDGVPIVLMCTPNEYKYNHLQLLADYIMQEFNYPVYDYKALKKGTEVIVEIDEKRSLAKVNKILKKGEKLKKEKALSNDKSRDRYLRSLSKRELKEELKKRGLYIDGMDRSDMIDMLDAFI